MRSILKTALLNALLTALYVAGVGSFLFYGAEKNFGDTKTVLVPIFMLLLFVFSAALSGALIFGQPILWYINGEKREALSLLSYTLGILFLVTFTVLLILIPW